MARKTEPFPEYEKWTTARFFGFLRSNLRRAWTKWPPKYEVLKNARRPVNKGRQKWEYQCDKCKGWFQGKEVQVDHTIPAGTLKSFEDLPKFAENLFVGVDKLTVLCKNCHSQKTKEERNMNKEDTNAN